MTPHQRSSTSLLYLLLSLVPSTIMLGSSVVTGEKVDLEAQLRNEYRDRGNVITERTTSLTGLDEPVRYLEAGRSDSRNVVVLLHGMAFTAETWKWTGTIDSLAEASGGGFRVVAPDLNHYRGPYGSRDLHHNLLADFLKAAVGFDASAPKSLLIVAASMGGAVGSPYVLDPKTGPNVAGYVSASAVIDAQHGGSSTETPALLIWGERDRPTSTKAKETQRLFEVHEMKVIPNAPHPSYLKEPVLFNEWLVQFATGRKDDRGAALSVFADWGDATPEF